MECMFQAIRLETAKAEYETSSAGPQQPPSPPSPRRSMPPQSFAPGLQELAMASSCIEPPVSTSNSSHSMIVNSDMDTGNRFDIESASSPSASKSTTKIHIRRQTPSIDDLANTRQDHLSMASDSHTESEVSDVEDFQDDKVSLAGSEGRSPPVLANASEEDSDSDATNVEGATATTPESVVRRRKRTNLLAQDNSTNNTDSNDGLLAPAQGDADNEDFSGDDRHDEGGDEDSACSFQSRHETYEISKSPYSTDERFEWDEDVFASMSQILTPVSCPWLRQSSAPCEDAYKYFGKELANDVIKFCDAIESTGMAYSPLWTEGQTINGQTVPRIPGPIMLICLWEAKISGADSASVQRVVLDLGVYGLVAEAILDWKMVKDFPGLRAMLLEASKSAALRRKLFGGAYKLDCQLCAIFVARAFQASLILQRKAPESRLRAKVKACLDMMADHISTVDSMTIITSASAPSVVAQGKKRGRKPKSASARALKRRKSDASLPVVETSKSNHSVNDSRYLTPTPKARIISETMTVTDTKKSVAVTGAESCDSSTDSLPISTTPRKVQLCSCQDGSVLVTFDSLKKAGAATEMNRGRIKERISEGKVDHKDFFWRYEPEPIVCAPLSAATPSPRPKKEKKTKERKSLDKSLAEDEDDDDDEDYAPNFPSLSPTQPSLSNYSSPRPIEKVCTKSGQTLCIYDTQAAACDAVGVSRSFFCQRMKSAPTTFSGYMWRWAEESAGATPSKDKSASSSSSLKHPGRPGKSVEKCSLETGAVLATFGSLRKAAKSLGISNTNFGHMMKQAPVEHEGYLWRLSKSS